MGFPHVPPLAELIIINTNFKIANYIFFVIFSMELIFMFPFWFLFLFNSDSKIDKEIPYFLTLPNSTTQINTPFYLHGINIKNSSVN